MFLESTLWEFLVWECFLGRVVCRVVAVSLSYSKGRLFLVLGGDIKKEAMEVAKLAKCLRNQCRCCKRPLRMYSEVINRLVRRRLQ